jgi:Carboxypeptidase regulatory-like domain
MSVALFRVPLVFCCCLPLLAQAPSPAASSPSASGGAIAGVVIDRGSNAPLRRAIVTLSTLEAQPQDAVAWTDANGRFGFSNLLAGSYELSVTKNGYQRAVYGSEDPRRPPGAIRLAAGELRNDLVLRMAVPTSVGGLVLDETGFPVEGVQIMALRQGWQRQKRELLPGPSGVSDSSGRWLITGIIPGRYAFMASMSNRPVLRINPEVSAGASQPRYVYGSQYYPGTDRSDSATLITVEPGREDPQIDFRIAPQPMAQVQGRIVLPAGLSSVDQVSILAVSADSANRMRRSGTGASKPDYVFRFEQFPPGSYTLMAQAEHEGKRYRGVQEIVAGPEGLRDLAIVLEPGIDLSGSVSIEGPDAAKLSASFVSLAPGDGVPLNGPQPRANVGKDGRFTIAGIPPGVWDINAAPIPPGGYIKSMYLGDQDVLTEEMVIRPSTTAPLKIVLGTQAASLTGDVSSGDQPSRSVVLAAPDGKFRHVRSFYRFAATDGEGHFQIKGLTPGNYKLFAFEEFDPQSIEDPEFLPPFEQAGIAVALREGDNPPQKLRMIPAANAARSGAKP